jgi:hypothetical protein
MAGDAAKQPLVQLQRKVTSSAKQTLVHTAAKVRFPPKSTVLASGPKLLLAEVLVAAPQLH